MKLPQSWPEFVSLVLTNPKVFLALLVLLVLLYVLLRAAGYDVLPPLLAKLGLKTVKRNIDISGDWKYRCTVIGGPFCEWGGTASIRQEVTAYGIQWKLFGQRLWENEECEPANKVTRPLPTAYPWETNWGIITPEPSVRFGYRITTAEGTIEGHAYGDIKYSRGKPQVIVGKFYQLPPYKPVHGKLEFERILNESETSW